MRYALLGSLRVWDDAGAEIPVPAGEQRPRPGALFPRPGPGGGVGTLGAAPAGVRRGSGVRRVRRHPAGPAGPVRLPSAERALPRAPLPGPVRRGAARRRAGVVPTGAAALAGGAGDGALAAAAAVLQPDVARR